MKSIRSALPHLIGIDSCHLSILKKFKFLILSVLCLFLKTSFFKIIITFNSYNSIIFIATNFRLVLFDSLLCLVYAHDANSILLKESLPHTMSHISLLTSTFSYFLIFIHSLCWLWHSKGRQIVERKRWMNLSNHLVGKIAQSLIFYNLWSCG